jgi:hypothetical protein
MEDCWPSGPERYATFTCSHRRSPRPPPALTWKPWHKGAEVLLLGDAVDNWGVSATAGSTNSS